MKRFIVIIVVIAVILSTYLATRSLFYSTIPPSEIFVSEISNSNKRIALKGIITSSAIKYKDYKYRYENDKLYIIIKGGIISFTEPKEIELSILYDNRIINEVFLEGDTPSENLQIWPVQ